MAAAAPRRRRLPGQRRRVEDEGEEDGGPDAIDLLDDDSLTEGSVASDDNDPANDSDTSNVDEASPTTPNVRKSTGNGLAKAGHVKHATESAVEPVKPGRRTLTDTDVMLNGLSISDEADKTEPVPEMHFDDLQEPPPTKPAAPMVISSASASIPHSRSQSQQPGQSEPPHERRRREHEEYRRKRDEDPAFVPNRGAFFMHDHRGAGPSANGFRPFSRGGARGRGRGGPFGGHAGFGFAGQQPSNINSVHNVANAPLDPTTNAHWAHDMHDAVVVDAVLATAPGPITPRYNHNLHYAFEGEGPPNGNGFVPRRPPNPTPINRTLSTEKHIGNAQVRVFLPELMEKPMILPGLAVKQYTKLPDHRPPLRRDKPVRISLPDNPPRYIFPASDRSFIFIPRAMRPNQQQRTRGKPRSVLGSMGGFSRRTSIYGGGGSYYGSVYSPSIAMSRRSSMTHEMGPPRDYLISPTGSTISRPPLPMDTSRPVVRLPPSAMPSGVPAGIPAGVPSGAPPGVPPAGHPEQGLSFVVSPLAGVGAENVAQAPTEKPLAAAGSSINDLPQPQVHPLPQKPNFQESRPTTIPMHQPRPQKTVSVETIESPTMSMTAPQSYQQQAFHHQVPAQVSNTYYNQDMHHRRPSYQSQPRTTGTPLSQIPERAIHAAPFQPHVYAQQQHQHQHQHQQQQQQQQLPPMQPPYYGQQPYPMMPPQQGYFYPPPSFGPSAAAAPPFVPAAQQQQGPGVDVSGPPQQSNGGGGPASQNPNLITQEVNGTFYFYDASQLQAVAGYPSYPPQQFVPGVVGLPGMVTPSPDAFYYPQGPPPGMMYYSQ